jgi:hypothetical protein
VRFQGRQEAEACSSGTAHQITILCSTRWTQECILRLHNVKTGNSATESSSKGITFSLHLYSRVCVPPRCKGLPFSARQKFQSEMTRPQRSADCLHGQPVPPHRNNDTDSHEQNQVNSSADSGSYRCYPALRSAVSCPSTGVFLEMILSLLFVLLHSSDCFLVNFSSEKASTQRDGYKT